MDSKNIKKDYPLNQLAEQIINKVHNDPRCSQAAVFKYGALAIPTTSDTQSKLYRLQSFFAAKMSPQSKDERTFKTCRAIFDEFQPFTLEHLSTITEEQFETLLKKVGHGFAKTHSKQIVKCIQLMVNEYDSDLPKTRQDMMKLPGVGPKVANLLMDLCWNEQYMVVDTHCIRCGERIGIHHGKNAKTALAFIEENVDPKYYKDLSVSFVALGQQICKADKPKCQECPLNSICDYYKLKYKPKEEKKTNKNDDIEDVIVAKKLKKV